MKVKSFFHPSTYTLSFIAYDEKTKDAAIIDSVVDYDPKSSTISYTSPRIMMDFVKNNNLNIHYILETHAHADHLTGASYIKNYFPNAKVGIGSGIKDVQTVFKGLFQLNDADTTGKDFDVLFEDGQEVTCGSLTFKVITTPGHTPACVTYLFNNEAAFTGDSLFAPDFGTGRCDFPSGSSKTMFHSIHDKIYKLPKETLIYPGHDYMPGGRIVWEATTLENHLNNNIHITPSTSETEYTTMRDARDATLDAPVLLLQSVQFNAWGGKMLKDKEPQFLKMPLRKKD
jgi:glyoxylase-like metal-dependent hydrolase (beta-lactamase superfamily II)